MTYLPAWQSGLLLALIPIFHWLFVRRMLAVSGRFSKLVDRVRFGPEEDAEDPMSDEEMIAAIQAMALAEFGEEALAGDDDESADEETDDGDRVRAMPQPTWVHIAFLVALILGGVLSQVLSGGGLDPAFTLGSAGFEQAFGGMTPAGIAALLIGGMLIGWGTRMAGGCTSGHGLCGVSRVQPGSILATAAFFGTGIVVSFVIGMFG